MPKYHITIEEKVTYEVEVVALHVDAAEDAAEQAFVNDPDLNFPTTVHTRRVSNVEMIE
ncbi:hypothetical protein IZ6_25630 [Terrihabitans soli]|uniref:Uncharacterized protein n=1 Tax=Terrihabitans soli TaxID=708113 RepID=A0A6S6QYZ3_9HYPH|nr:hypothetical protein [Terrihabitans soli]BCJ91828.1 hypothetical protein IZ6_25630 [Terrihabitans soli]